MQEEGLNDSQKAGQHTPRMISLSVPPKPFEIMISHLLIIKPYNILQTHRGLILFIQAPYQLHQGLPLDHTLERPDTSRKEPPTNKASRELLGGSWVVKNYLVEALSRVTITLPNIWGLILLPMNLQVGALRARASVRSEDRTNAE